MDYHYGGRQIAWKLGVKGVLQVDSIDGFGCQENVALWLFIQSLSSGAILKGP